MVRRPDAELVYEAAQSFKERCLNLGTSLLWPSSEAWSEDNLEAFRQAFVEHPDEGKRDFLTKLHDQLAGQPPAVHMVAADLHTFYLLFPSRISADHKLNSITAIASWADLEIELDRTAIHRTFTQAIGHTGPWYQTRVYLQVEYFLAFSQRALAEHYALDDPGHCQELADQVLDEMRGSAASARHVLLHLLFPDSYERISSSQHKRSIVETFKEYAQADTDIDESIRSIRQSLAGRFGQGFDFYDEPVRSLWQTEQTPPSDTQRSYWVEKTRTRRQDRIEGTYKVGQALWSPVRGGCFGSSCTEGPAYISDRLYYRPRPG